MSQTILEAPVPLTLINTKPQPASLHDLPDILDHGPLSTPAAASPRTTSQRRATLLILTLSLLTGVGSFTTGLLTIELPTIVAHIDLDASLIL